MDSPIEAPCTKCAGMLPHRGAGNLPGKDGFYFIVLRSLIPRSPAASGRGNALAIPIQISSGRGSEVTGS
ncbi:MAG: hypothetical protein C0407_01885 [Desulfobacca sp.]|nr:hypothetical protein [Desulfobacca sp.]